MSQFQHRYFRMFINYFYFSALASADLVFVMTCIPHGIRVATNSTFFILYPIFKFFNQFAYTTSIFLTVTLIIHRYMVFVRQDANRKNDFTRIKKIIAAIVIASFLYSIPMMFEYRWENGLAENGKSKVVSWMAEDEKFKHVYKAWIGSIFRFLIPCICLVVFSILLVREVIMYIHEFIQTGTSKKMQSLDFNNFGLSDLTLFETIHYCAIA